MNKYYIFFSILSIFVIITLVLGFIMLNGFSLAKEREFDSLRLSNIEGIKRTIDLFTERNNRLPYSLEEASASYLKDPQTKKDYTFVLVSSKDYKICANFSTDTFKTTNQNKTDDKEILIKLAPHKKGYDCISYSANIKSPRSFSTPSGTHRDGNLYCINHGGIALTIPYNITRGDWSSCLAWCDKQMSKTLPLCQYNSDGPRNCWINYPPGGTTGSVMDCNWISGTPPYGAWWKGFEKK